MTQNSKDLVKAIFIAIFTFLVDLVFGYSIFFITTLGLKFWLAFFAIALILFLLIPWNIFVWIALKQAIKSYKEYKNNNSITQ